MLEIEITSQGVVHPAARPALDWIMSDPNIELRNAFDAFIEASKSAPAIEQWLQNTNVAERCAATILQIRDDRSVSDVDVLGLAFCIQAVLDPRRRLLFSANIPASKRWKPKIDFGG